MDTNSAQRSIRCVGDGTIIDLAAWRRRRLLEAGFPDHGARTLAAAPGLDLHELLQLVDQGWQPNGSDERRARLTRYRVNLTMASTTEKTFVARRPGRRSFRDGHASRPAAGLRADGAQAGG